MSKISQINETKLKNPLDTTLSEKEDLGDIHKKKKKM